MIHPGIHAALARERTSTFLPQAEAARLARQLIRPVRPADDGLLADGFAAELDHRHHEALGALDHAREGGVGIALEYEGELTCAPVRRARFRGNAPGPVEMS